MTAKKTKTEAAKAETPKAKKKAKPDKAPKAADTTATPAKVPEAAKTPAKKSAKAKPAGPKKLSALDAAAKVLGEEGRAMTSQEMIEAMAAKGYWSSPAGKTPSATLYA